MKLKQPILVSTPPVVKEPLMRWCPFPEKIFQSVELITKDSAISYNPNYEYESGDDKDDEI